MSRVTIDPALATRMALALQARDAAWRAREVAKARHNAAYQRAAEELDRASEAICREFQASLVQIQQQSLAHRDWAEGGLPTEPLSLPAPLIAPSGGDRPTLLWPGLNPLDQSTYTPF